MIKTSLTSDIKGDLPEPVYHVSPSLGYVAESSQQGIYKKVVDSAREATDAFVVVLDRYDSEAGLVYHFIASGLETQVAKQEALHVRQLFHAFDPTNYSFSANINPLIQSVFLSGKSISAPISKYAKGVTDDLVVRMYSSALGINYVTSCPVRAEGGDVIGSLSFLTAEPLDKNKEVICEMFADQAAFIFINDVLQISLNTQIKSLRESRDRITNAEERVRRDIAEMLHGKVQSSLLVAWHQLGRCADMFNTNPSEAKAILEQVRAEIDRIREKEVREASHLLHPSIIQVALIPALKSLARRFNQNFKISINCDSSITERDNVAMNQIPEQVRLTAYRVVEEALNNVAKHAGASAVEISLKLISRHRMQITICDNGQGFFPNHSKIGMGLMSLDDRITSLGGDWNISSSLGFGTTLTAYLPLKQD